MESNKVINSGQFKQKYFFDRDQLYDLYITKNLSIFEVAKALNVLPRTVAYLLQKEKIKKDRKASTQIALRNNLIKYGKSCTLQTSDVNKKARKTCINRYGYEYATQNKSVYDKIIQTNLNRYGVTSTGQVKEFINKRKETCLQKYGVENYTQTNEYLQKSYITKKKNHSFNLSKPELQIFKLLKEKFKDVKHQYKSEKYPFDCDFYIPEEDLYIEYQGFWNHYTKPFMETTEDLQVLNKWKSKSEKSPGYVTAIDVWTKRDPLKRKVAKENNLNWIEFFDMQQFLEWYNRE